MPGHQLDTISRFRGAQQLATMGRLPIVAGWFEGWERDGKDNPPRGFSHTSFRLPDGRLLLTYNLHLKSNAGGAPASNRIKREAAIRQLLAHIDSELPKYREETPSASYLQRTEWNVRDNDGTVVFTLAPVVTGGSLRTVGFARKHKKPCLHVSRAAEGGLFSPSMQLQEFVREHGIKTLNVAGSRESKEPGIHDWVMQVLEDAFFGIQRRPGNPGRPKSE